MADVTCEESGVASNFDKDEWNDFNDYQESEEDGTTLTSCPEEQSSGGVKNLSHDITTYDSIVTETDNMSSENLNRLLSRCFNRTANETDSESISTSDFESLSTVCLTAPNSCLNNNKYE